tara:strand:- start:450 stop:734 length:285 start_codon:yes stop_codon:yes gene_type:complete
MKTTTEPVTVEERSRELWELERQQREEDRGGDCPDMPERLSDPNYLTPAQRAEDRKKTDPEFLHVVIKGHVLTSLDACIFGAGFVAALLLMIIF